MDRSHQCESVRVRLKEEMTDFVLGKLGALGVSLQEEPRLEDSEEAGGDPGLEATSGHERILSRRIPRL